MQAGRTSTAATTPGQENTGDHGAKAVHHTVRQNLAASLDVISRSNELRMKAHEERLWMGELRERTHRLREESKALFARARETLD